VEEHELGGAIELGQERTRGESGSFTDYERQTSGLLKPLYSGPAGSSVEAIGSRVIAGSQVPQIQPDLPTIGVQPVAAQRDERFGISLGVKIH